METQFAFLQGNRSQFPLGDIQAETDVTDKIALRVVPRRAVILNPAILAVVTAQAVIHAEFFTAGKGALIDVDAARPVVRVYAFDPAIASFLFGVLGISFGGWIGYLVAGVIGSCILIGIVRAVKR